MVFGGERPEMTKHVLAELLLPFVGTSLGAGSVFFLKKGLDRMVRRALTGFAAGVMVAASVWSLLIPAMEQAADMGRRAFLPAVTGFWMGVRSAPAGPAENRKNIPEERAKGIPEQKQRHPNHH